MKQVKIVYEDNNIIIADKPRNMSVTDDDIRPSLIGILSTESGITLYPCHRIDAMTSGLVLAAKSKEIQQAAFEEFRKPTEAAVSGRLSDEGIIKTYNCMVTDTPRQLEGILRHYLLKDEKNQRVYAYDHQKSGTKIAVMKYKVIQAGHPAVIETRLHTGRTHQIRAQLSHIGCPILGDDKYGDRSANKQFGIRKLQLSAVKMEFQTRGSLEYLKGLVVEIPPSWSSLSPRQ